MLSTSAVGHEIDAHMEMRMQALNLERAWLEVGIVALRDVGLQRRPWEATGILAIADGLNSLNRYAGNTGPVPEELVRGVVSTMVESPDITTEKPDAQPGDFVETMSERFKFLRITRQMDGMSVTQGGHETLARTRNSQRTRQPFTP